MINLRKDGVDFVDYESYLEVIKARDEANDRLAIEVAKRTATRAVIENWVNHIVKVSSAALTADDVYGHINNVMLNLGPGIQIQVLAEVQHRLNVAHARIHERAIAGVALTYEDDDYGISD